MPDEAQTDPGVLNRPHNQTGQGTASSSRRSSSTISLRPRINRSPSPSRGSRVPLTPEESPPFRSTKKRSAGVVEQEDKAIASAEASPAHTRSNSGDPAPHICLCQPDPKIPRPRNAFILYRQHHQANVVAQNPGLPNPEISKIIGERWQTLPQEEKGKWKALAEEEKLRHQQQYPSYRYQPKRNGRRNSLSSDLTAGERPKCAKCGGRAFATPSTPFSTAINTTIPPTPGTATITPVTRTLPVLRDLNLQSPRGAYLGQQHPMSMSPPHNIHPDERDDVGPLSPDAKRRRINGDHSVAVNRAMPPRYGAPPSGAAVGPGTPFPFSQAPPAPHPYSAAAAHARRESLPGLRGVVSPPGQMGPPPRPGMGYQAHRMSQGHVAPDRSLTLPPIQTAPASGRSTGADPPKTAEEQIMSAGFRYKVRVLSQVAPPASRNEHRRGPLIAVEGDSPEAVKGLATWLNDALTKEIDIAPTLIDGPEMSPHGSKEQMMAQYHGLAAEWLTKSNSILQSITVAAAAPSEAGMTDAASDTVSPEPKERPAHGNQDSEAHADAGNEKRADDHSSQSDKNESAPQEKMDIDKRGSTISTTSTASTRGSRPVAIVSNYSLHASNRFACAIPIGGTDPYSPNDHWQWAATQWRGIIGPDLTIYVRDAAYQESGRPPFEMEPVEGKSDAALFVVRCSRVDEHMGEGDGQEATMQVEPAVLRRVCFEVGEMVRAFGGRSSKG